MPLANSTKLHLFIYLFIQTDNLCLLIGAFNLLTFNAITVLLGLGWRTSHCSLISISVIYSLFLCPSLSDFFDCIALLAFSYISVYYFCGYPRITICLLQIPLSSMNSYYIGTSWSCISMLYLVTSYTFISLFPFPFIIRITSFWAKKLILVFFFYSADVMAIHSLIFAFVKISLFDLHFWAIFSLDIELQVQFQK